MSLSLAIVAAVVAAISLVLTLPGLGWLLTGLALAAVAIFTGLARPSATVASSRAPEAVPAFIPETAEKTGDDAGNTGEDRANAATTDVANSPDAGTSTDSTGAPGGTQRPRLSWRTHGERIGWGVLALALLSVGTFRAAGWLFFWCVVFALACSALSLAGGRTVKAVFLSVLTLPASVVRSPAWIVRGVRAMNNRDGAPRILIATAISVLLLVIFGGLFAGADAEFAHVLGSVLPPLRASEVARAVFCFVVVGALACGVGFLAAARTRLDDLPPSAPRRVRRAEWVLPLAVLNVLFAVFVFIQLTVLFRRDPKLLNASHAYMRGYAHSGFWQLLVVTILTLTVLGVSGRVAPRETRADRVLLRVLLGGLTVFSIVIVLSALKRVSAYEHAYGFTRLRVVVAGVEIWFGLLFVIVLVAGIRLRAAWLPRVIVASLALSLLAGAIANPDRYVAQHNVNRYQDTGKLSISYMRQMSADAVPAIEQLPPRLRACALRDEAKRLASRGDDWRTWNVARVHARNKLGVFVLPPPRTCSALIR